MKLLNSKLLPVVLHFECSSVIHGKIHITGLQVSNYLLTVVRNKQLNN